MKPLNEISTRADQPGSIPRRPAVDSSCNRNRSGSTIVGVLAALTFIGVVVAVMVKMTGSQSAASVGYGAEMTMNSTVASGFVATEAYLGNTAPATVLEKINSASQKPYILGGEKNMEKLANNQFFSSRLLDFNKDNNIATVEIKSGNKNNGKALKRAIVLYRFENVEADAETETPATSSSNAKNAVFSKSPLGHGNAAINVEDGPATFLSDATFQNYNSVFKKRAYFGGKADFAGNNTVEFFDTAYFQRNAKFDGVTTFNNMAYFGDSSNATFSKSVTFSSAYFKKDATFGEAATFNNVAYFGGDTAKFSNSATFNSDAYFGKLVKFQNGPNVVFNRRVGFDDKIETTLMMRSPNNFDVYMNANFTSTSSTGMLRGKQNPPLDSQEVYYSEKVTDTDLDKFEWITIHNQRSSGMTALNKLKALTPSITPPIPPNPNDLTDPQLNIQLVYNDTSTTKNPPGKVKIFNAYELFDNTFSLNTLQSTYDGATKEQRYDGKYLVVEVTSQITFNTPPKDSTFNGNVIFIVKNGGTLSVNENFYISGPKSSTLIYVGSGDARLDNFGSDGLFRGFIYIDTGNTIASEPYNSIKFGKNGYIEGAVHNFSNNLLRWNGGEANMAILVKFDPTVLSGFGSLYGTAVPDNENDNSEEGNMTLAPNATKIKVTPLGYYFY